MLIYRSNIPYVESNAFQISQFLDFGGCNAYVLIGLGTVHCVFTHNQRISILCQTCAMRQKAMVQELDMVLS